MDSRLTMTTTNDSFNWGTARSASIWQTMTNVSNAVTNMTTGMMSVQEMATLEIQNVLQADALRIDNPADETIASGQAPKDWSTLSPTEKMAFDAWAKNNDNGSNYPPGWNYRPTNITPNIDWTSDLSTQQQQASLDTQVRTNDADQGDNITGQINGVVSNLQGRITELLTIGQSLLTLWQNLVS